MNIDRLSEELRKFIDDEKNFNIAIIKASMFQPELIEALDEFLNTGVLPTFSIDGISLKTIMQKINCNEIQAFYNMDELMKDDEYRSHFMNMSFGRK